MTIDNVAVSISVGDASVSQAGFGVPLILPAQHSVFTDRTKEYSDIESVGNDFATTTKTYMAASALFGQTTKQGKSIEKIKVGRIDAGDADMTESLNEIVQEDNDWYCLIVTDRTSANIEMAAVWIETQAKIFIVSVEDSDVIASGSSDLASTLRSASYKRTALIWNHEGGEDHDTGNTIEVTSDVATVTKTGHGLREGDSITVSGATDFGSDADVLNGNKVISSIVDADDYTYAATGAADGAATGSIEVFARYAFADAAWVGSCLPDYPGSITWKFQTLSGITATPKTLMDTSERGYAEGKNANLYVQAAGVSYTTEAVMAGGRFIDIQRGVDWLDARLEEAVFTQLVNLKKIPYTNAGLSIIENAMREVLNKALARTVISPISDEQAYTITIPKVSAIATADKLNRLFPDISFTALVGNAVHGVTIQGTLSV